MNFNEGFARSSPLRPVSGSFTGSKPSLGPGPDSQSERRNKYFADWLIASASSIDFYACIFYCSLLRVQSLTQKAKPKRVLNHEKPRPSLAWISIKNTWSEGKKEAPKSTSALAEEKSFFFFIYLLPNAPELGFPVQQRNSSAAKTSKIKIFCSFFSSPAPSRAFFFAAPQWWMALRRRTERMHLRRFFACSVLCFSLIYFSIAKSIKSSRNEKFRLIFSRFTLGQNRANQSRAKFFSVSPPPSLQERLLFRGVREQNHPLLARGRGKSGMENEESQNGGRKRRKNIKFSAELWLRYPINSPSSSEQTQSRNPAIDFSSTAAICARFRLRIAMMNSDEEHTQKKRLIYNAWWNVAMMATAAVVVAASNPSPGNEERFLIPFSRAAETKCEKRWGEQKNEKTSWPSTA